MNRINTLDDLKEARSQPRALVFLYVNWATQARRSKERVEELINYWKEDAGHCPTADYSADLSEQKGELWESVRQWLHSEAKPVDSLTYGGNGALLWLRDGRVVEYAEYAGAINFKVLMAISRRVFEEMKQ